MGHDTEHRIGQVPAQETGEAPIIPSQFNAGQETDPTVNSPDKKRVPLWVKIGAPAVALLTASSAWLIGVNSNEGPSQGQGQEQVDDSNQNTNNNNSSGELDKPEVNAPETMVTTFLGITVPESVSEAPDTLPTDIMKGDLYETLSDEQRARVDTWVSAIHDGTYLDLPVGERFAALFYAIGANSGGANVRIRNSDRAYLRDIISRAGTPSTDNTVEQAVLQCEVYQILVGQFAIDSDPSPDVTSPTLDTTLASNLLAGIHTDRAGQILLSDRMNQVNDAMMYYPDVELGEATILDGTRTDDTIEANASAGSWGTYHYDLSLVGFVDIYDHPQVAWASN